MSKITKLTPEQKKLMSKVRQEWLDWKVMQGNHRVAVARSLEVKEIEAYVWTGTEMVL